MYWREVSFTLMPWNRVHQISASLLVLSGFFLFSACHRAVPSETQTPAVPSYAWTTSSPQAQNVDPDSLALADQDFGSKGYVESFVVVRNGFLIHEHYYTSAGMYVNSDVASVTKSFTSAFVGIALSQKYLDSLGQRMMSFFREYDSPSLDSLKRQITIEHLLTMCSGFAYDESQDHTYIFNESTNCMQQAINLPMAAKPGQTFNYASVNAHVVSGILTKATHLSTFNLAEIFLFKPLGINVLS
jgi:CubicO group peptidase (beta-lactamase class C family)